MALRDLYASSAFVDGAMREDAAEAEMVVGDPDVLGEASNVDLLPYSPS
jgi:hypothetical protein